MNNVALWDLANNDAALILRNKQAVWGQAVTVYIISDPSMTDEAICEDAEVKFGGRAENYAVQRNKFIKLLYFAVIRARVGMRICEPGYDPMELDFMMLKEMSPVIEQLSIICAYKADVIDYDQFMEDMEDQPLYYSTPYGTDDEGNQRIFLSTSPNSNDMFFPVFIAEDNLRTFFDEQNRHSYAVTTGTLQEVFDMLDEDIALYDLGVVIEPLHKDVIELPASLRRETGQEGAQKQADGTADDFSDMSDDDDGLRSYEDLLDDEEELEKELDELEEELVEFEEIIVGAAAKGKAKDKTGRKKAVRAPKSLKTFSMK